MNILSRYLSIAFKIIVILLVLVGVPLFLQNAAKFEAFQEFRLLVEHNLFAYIALLLTGKMISIVYPPLPGAVLTVGSIPLIGWELAYAVDIIGSSLGASIAFFLGKKHGISLLRWALGEKVTAKVTSVTVKQQSQVEAAIIFRIMAGGLLSDGLAWGAPLIGFRYIPFIIGYFISHLITTLPIFYLLSLSADLNTALIVLPLMVVAWLAMLLLKGRYLE